MKKLKICLLSILLSFTVSAAWGQGKVKTNFQHFILDTNAALFTQQKNNETNITVVGGFIQIRPSASIFEHLTSRTYFTSKNGGEEKKTDNSISNEIYLRVGDTFSVDILDKKSDQLVHRYNITRISFFPNLQVQIDDNGKKTQIKSSNNEPTEVNVTNAKSLELARKDTLDLSIEYKLVDLNTKKTVDNNVLKGNLHLNLKPKTEYELRVNYVVQPESVQIYYIKNEGAWFQKENNLLAIGIIVLAIVIAFVLKKMTNKVRYSKSEVKKMEDSAIRLQSMLNPHFTFNALNTVQGLMNTGRIDEANLYLENFGTLLRQSLAKSQTLYHSLDQELEMMRLYLKIEALRFNFEWEINVDYALPLPEIEIPTLLMQPIIENAVKHGLKNVEKGKISIHCNVHSDTLIINIRDNGTWQDNPAGYGLKNTQDRIDTINKLRNNQAISLNFDKSNGTIATLTFFNWLKND